MPSFDSVVWPILNQITSAIDDFRSNSHHRTGAEIRQVCGWRLVLVVPKEGHGRHIHHTESTLRGLPLVATQESLAIQRVSSKIRYTKIRCFSIGETNINALLGYRVSWQSHKWSNQFFQPLRLASRVALLSTGAPWCTYLQEIVARADIGKCHQMPMCGEQSVHIHHDF